jgi:hypothetical protein
MPDVVGNLFVGDGALTLHGSPVAQNPMIAEDDLIVGYTDGMPDRLGKGSDNQVLTVDPATHKVAWADPTSGAPVGSAGGELAGSYPDPTVAATHSGSAHLALGNTAPSTQAFGDAAAAGSATTAAKLDHKHAMPALGAAVSTQAFGDVAGAGVATTPSKSDHKHGMPSLGITPSTQAFGDTADGGVATTPSKNDHKHAMPAAPTLSSLGAAPSTPDYLVGSAQGGLSAEIVVGTSPGGELGGTWASPTVDATHSGSTHAATQAAAESTASSALSTHAGSGHVALGSTPSTQAFGDVAAGGADTTASKNDHKHAMPANPVRAQSSTTPAAIGTGAVGTGTTDARADHVHATGAGTPSTQAFGDAAAVGTGPAAAMTDHKHAMPAAQTLSSLGAAPSTSDYLVGTADAGLSGEIVVGTSPGGELGGTWASPTVDATHSGSAHPLTGALEFQALTPVTGVLCDVELPFAGSFTGWTVLNNAAGSIQFDVWKDTYTNFPPVVGDAMTASDKPLTSSAAKAQGSCTGWGTFSAGDILRVNIDSVSGVARALLSLKYTRT